jgi:uncharacterized protein (AIM24 family)
MTDQIYVLIGADQVGPISEEEVRRRVAAGEVEGATLVWYPGLDQWQALEEVRRDLLNVVGFGAASDPDGLEVGARTVMIDDLSSFGFERKGQEEASPKEEPEPIERFFEPEPQLRASQLLEPEDLPRLSQVLDPAHPAWPRDAAAEPFAAPARGDQPLAEVRAAVAEPKQDAVESRPVALARRRWESHGTVFEVVYSDLHQMPKVVLKGSACVLEAGALHYMRGNVEIEVPKAKLSGFVKGALTKESATRPRYTGTGEVFLEPTFGEVNVLELDGEAWVLDRGAFLAADIGVELGVFTNKAWSGLIGGEGLFQTKVSGKGKVFFLSDGICERIDLRDEKLVVDGSFAVARSASLAFTVEKATKGLIGSLRSGEGFVNVIRGTGTVLIAPIPNRSQRLFRRLDLLGQMMVSKRR